MKRVVLLCSAAVIMLSLFLSGCNQKVGQKAQINNDPQTVKGTVGGTTNIEIPEVNNIVNTKYPDVVAQVGDNKIIGLQLARDVAIKKNNYVNNLKKPQDESFYEKVALGFLIKNALMDAEIIKQGITVTDEEAKSSLEQQKRLIESLPDNDPTKISYLQTIKADGFNNITEYLNSQSTIYVVKKTLERGKLRTIVLQSIPNGQNQATKAWDDYTDKQINEGNYKIFIPVDIKDYQQMERQVVLGK